MLDHTAQRTKASLIATYLLNEPMVCLFNLLAIILAKNLGASALQISIFTMLKPTVSVFSFYWSSLVSQKHHRLLTNLVGANILSVVPLLIIPFYNPVWYVIFASAIYILFSRASMPAMMEVLKINLSQSTRERVFALASTLGYTEGIILAFILGYALDLNYQLWKISFLIAGILVLISAYIQSQLPLREEEDTSTQSTRFFSGSLLEKITKPITDSLDLLKRRPDFSHFQKGFMIAMFGLMFAMPAIPFFLSDQKLSYTELMIAFNICKGLGFIAASPLWTKWMRTFSVNQHSSIVCIGFGVFYFSLLFASFGPLWLFIAYILYGIVQAGSNLLWHLSGSIFSGTEDSTPYSAVNVLLVGIRGAIVPPLGGVFSDVFGPELTIALGMLICFYGGWYLIAKQPCS